jgi:hypothetical protein
MCNIIRKLNVDFSIFRVTGSSCELIPATYNYDKNQPSIYRLYGPEIINNTNASYALGINDNVDNQNEVDYSGYRSRSIEVGIFNTDGLGWNVGNDLVVIDNENQQSTQIMGAATLYRGAAEQKLISLIPSGFHLIYYL